MKTPFLNVLISLMLCAGAFTFLLAAAFLRVHATTDNVRITTSVGAVFAFLSVVFAGKGIRRSYKDDPTEPYAQKAKYMFQWQAAMVGLSGLFLLNTFFLLP